MNENSCAVCGDITTYGAHGDSDVNSDYLCYHCMSWFFNLYITFKGKEVLE
jgi:hypothetical protein